MAVPPLSSVEAPGGKIVNGDAGMERHTDQGSACEVCGGHDRMRRGQGKRCHGFSSEKTIWCTQLESGKWSDSADAWAHRRHGECDCGLPEPRFTKQRTDRG